MPVCDAINSRCHHRGRPAGAYSVMEPGCSTHVWPYGNGTGESAADLVDATPLPRGAYPGHGTSDANRGIAPGRTNNRADGSAQRRHGIPPGAVAGDVEGKNRHVL